MNDERHASAVSDEETIGESGGALSMERSGAAASCGETPALPMRSAAETLSHREKRLIVACMMLPVFLGSVDQSILASALPTIGRSLGEVHNLPWLITAFLISSTALTPLYGKFADIHGRRAAMLIGITVYMIGSLIAAFSPNMLMLICGRVVQGCGAGGLTVTANMVLGDIAPPKDRGKYYIYFSVAFTTAGGIGPALGGWISEHLLWSVIFLWNFPLCVVALVIALTVLERLPRRERPHRLDIAGAVLVMAASSTFMLALNIGGVRYPWLSTPVVALFGGALVLGVALVARLLTAAEPLIPIAILSDRAARRAIAAHSSGWGAMVSLNVFLPMYLQSALGWSPTSSGLSMIILMVTLNVSAGLSGQLLGHVRHYKLLPLCFLNSLHRRGDHAGAVSRQHDAAKIRDPFAFDRCRLGADRAADASGAAEHGAGAPSWRGARHDELRTYAGRHDFGSDIRRDHPGAGAGRGGGRYARPQFPRRCVARSLRHRFFRGGRFAHCGVSVGDPARGKAARRTAIVVPGRRAAVVDDGLRGRWPVEKPAPKSRIQAVHPVRGRAYRNITRNLHSGRKRHNLAPWSHGHHLIYGLSF
ncbi:MAG: MFS transporter [Xanthobacteraceae bacterium]